MKDRGCAATVSPPHAWDKPEYLSIPDRLFSFSCAHKKGARLDCFPESVLFSTRNLLAAKGFSLMQVGNSIPLWPYQPAFSYSGGAVDRLGSSGSHYFRSASSGDALQASSIASNESASRPFRLYAYIAPAQAAALFALGLMTSLVMRFFLRGWSVAAKQPVSEAFSRFAQRADEVQQQTAAIISHRLISPLLYSLENPDARKGIFGYLAASVLGYGLASSAEAAQEIVVRKEETQIRAALLQCLSEVVRKSIRSQYDIDQQLSAEAKNNIRQALIQAKVPHPDELLRYTEAPPQRPDALQRYAYEPGILSAKLPVTAAFRFGWRPDKSLLADDPMVDTDAPKSLFGLKAAITGAGFLLGGLGQLMWQLLPKETQGSRNQPPQQAVIRSQLAEKGKQIIKKHASIMFNVNDMEALFLINRERRILLAVLGLAAAAKLGKMVVDGYREIEVTRFNARTEARFQAYQWLSLNTAYHRIAEEEAVRHGLSQFRQLLPALRHNREALRNYIHTLLGNIGRNSAPKYYPMTPAVPFVDAGRARI